MSSLALSLELVLRYADVRDADIGVQQDAGQPQFGKEFAEGVGLDEGDAIWHARRTLAATSEELDLAGGLSDAFGVAFSFAKLKLVLIKNRATVAGNALLIGGATNAVPLFADAADKLTLEPDGVFLVVHPSLAAIAVTAGTGDKLKIDSGSQNIEYDIILAGVKA